MIKHCTLFIGLFLLYGSKLCAQSPTISSFSPVNGPISSIVIIHGSNFSANIDSNIVFLGSVKALITNATTNQITVTVPAGTTYLPLSVLNTTNGLTAYSRNPFIVTTVGSKKSIATSDFVSKLNLVAAQPIVSMAVGDIDGDGKPDVVVTTQNYITVFQNTTKSDSITFAAGISIFYTFATNVQLIDIDGDGKPEIIFENSGSCSAFLNKTTPGVISADSFAGPENIGGYGRHFFADINGDGKPDLITYDSDRLANITQNFSIPGRFIFGKPNGDNSVYVSLNVPSNAIPVGAADIDGDGKPDLVFTDNDSTIYISKNVSDGGIITPATFLSGLITLTAPNIGTSLVIGDLNNDNKPDLAANNTSITNVVYSFRNTSVPGSISFAPVTSNLAPAYISDIHLADIDGDGLPDIIVTSAALNDVTVLHNTSTSKALAFSANTDIPAGSMPVSSNIADLNGDGKADFICSHSQSDTITVFRNNPVAAILATAAPPQIISFTPVRSAIDSIVQITGANFNAVTLLNHVNFGAAPGKVINASPNQITVQVPAGSSNLPISVLNLSTNLSANSSASFIPLVSPVKSLTSNSYSNKSGIYTGGSLRRPHIIDMNGDGRPDIVLIAGGGFSVYPSTVPGILSFGGNLTIPTIYPVPGVEDNITGFDVCDIDGDGKPDVILHTQYQNMDYVYINTTVAGSYNIKFAAPVILSLRLINNYGYTFGDIDGDGKTDLIVTTSDRVAVYLNTSSPGKVSFAGKTSYGFYSSPFVLCDVDGDGKTDVVCITTQATACVFRNISIKGGVAFAGGVTFATNTLPDSFYDGKIMLSDINGDQKPDIICYSNSGNIHILKNTSLPGLINFDSQLSFDLTHSITNISDIKAADMDGDGKSDITVTDLDYNIVSIFRNLSSKQNINLAPPVDIHVQGFPENLAVNDLGGDSAPELIISGNTNIEIRTNGNPIEIVTSKDTLFYESKNVNSILIDTNLRIFTAYTSRITSVKIMISGNYNPTQDLLSFKQDTSKMGDINGTFDKSTGTLTLTTQTKFPSTAKWQTALRSIRYSNSNLTRPDTNLRTVSFQMTDYAEGKSNIALKNIRIGPGSLSNFPIPIIVAEGPLTFAKGDSVLLEANPSTGFEYQWLRNGVAISGANTSTYTALLSGAYTVITKLDSLTATSDTVSVNAIFKLPQNNFLLTISSATCRGSSDGSVSFTVVQSLSYTAKIFGGAVNASQAFTDSVKFNGLTAGTYNLSITVDGEPGYEQDYTIVIIQPADLSAYAIVNNTTGIVDLSLSGGSVYTIFLNGKTYTTTASDILLPLVTGDNDVVITTDKFCQGRIEKHISFSGVLPYPNPFQKIINLDLGSTVKKNVNIEVHNSNGNSVYNKQLNSISGVIQLDLSWLDNGIYVLHLSTDGISKTFKIDKQ